jgi:hypothetical protein
MKIGRARWKAGALGLLLGVGGISSTLTAANEALAGPPSPQDASIDLDPAAISTRYHEILRQPEYQEPTEPDAHAQLRDWLARWFNRVGQDFEHFRYAEEMPRFASMVMTLLGVLAAGTLLYLLVRVGFKKRTADRDLSPDDAPSRAHGHERGEDDLQRAVTAGDWRRAWLASWREFLHLMERRQLVERDRSRTNHEYLEQLKPGSLPAPALRDIERMVREYDEFIYGDRPVAEDDWKHFQNMAEEAALALHLHEKTESSAT